jgi:two-component system NtrC family sensor kinase
MSRRVVFGTSEMMSMRTQLQALTAQECQSTEDVARQLVSLYRTAIRDDAGRRASALVRIYKTHSYHALDPTLQDFARRLEPAADTIPNLRCLVLLATEGDEADWNSRQASRGHQVIPLSSEDAIRRAPMIFQLVLQLGIKMDILLRPDPTLLLDANEQTQGVFYVPDALGSPFIPAQAEFVVPNAITSVVGFGGIVGSGDLFVTIVFSRAEITRESADLFRIIGLNFKLAMMRCAAKPLWASAAQVAEPVRSTTSARRAPE